MSPSTDAASPAPIDGASAHPHNFEAQKEIHRSIRNDPDYDDWEYGTEPLPQEAWVEPPATASGAPSGEPPARP
jgi:hypothetical protein